MSDSIVINTTKKRRVWEVDFIRGFCMLFVIWDHLMYDFGMIFLFDFSTPVGQAIGRFAREYWYSGIRAATHDYFVGAFVVVSGLSTVFSKNNWIKALKVFAAAMVVTIATHVATETGMVSGVVINYGVLHMLATCGIVYCVLKALRVPDWMIFVLGVAALTLGFYFESVNLREPIGLIFLFENMSARGEYDTAPAGQLIQVAALHKQIAGLLRLGLADAAHVAHLAECREIFVAVGLVDK